MKTVSITPTARAGGRKRPSPTIAETVGDAPSPAAPAARPARHVQAQPMHRYRIGERLRMANGGYSVARVGAFCKVMSLLPYEGHGALLYRVRSETEQFERVVAEADLTRNFDAGP